MYLNVLRLSILFLCVLVQNAAAQACRAKNSISFNMNHFNVRLNGYVIRNMTTPAAADCARECFRLTPCLSFNMAASIGLCQLNSVNSSTNLSRNLVADKKFNYFDLSVLSDTFEGPCSKKPCLMHQICLPTNGKHTCANVECPPYKAPTNGKVKPTTAVIAGQNVTVSCRAGFRIVGDRLLTCQFGGHWRGVAPKCKDDCDDYLISGPESIPDESLTATSSYIANSEHFSRLNNTETQPGDGAWSVRSRNLNQWIQARFDTPKTVKGIAIQGRDGIRWKQYVKTFSVSYSTDCSTFQVVSNADGTKMKFTGNTDVTTIVTNMLPARVTALCVRLHPITYFSHMSLRWDIIGC